ncbi:hypothetical protein [Comamonas sp. JNW]|uniref:hypothetical protein n=1 Tax=Comamonas sp. JNW TaxID=2170731 RepID=UPI000DE65A4A|nr:hypothetical protein [Comamonas sp. JNW]PWB17952.1 hypothetical protein DCO45_13705 [Comamonas sp. JNW]
MTKTLILTALCTALASACSSTPAPRPACPSALQMEQPELLGHWQAELPGLPGPVTLQLAPHPEWNGTVKGQIQRPGSSAIVVGDVDKGKLTMEESADGKKVSGTWLGEVVDGSCGREIRGEWLDANDNSHAFVMRKPSKTPQ